MIITASTRPNERDLLTSRSSTSSKKGMIRRMKTSAASMSTTLFMLILTTAKTTQHAVAFLVPDIALLHNRHCNYNTRSDHYYYHQCNDRIIVKGHDAKSRICKPSRLFGLNRKNQPDDKKDVLPIIPVIGPIFTAPPLMVNCKYPMFNIHFLFLSK